MIQLTSEIKDESYKRKVFNVKAFSSLDKSGLAYGSVERRLLMREYPTGEKVYIQYPGKETIREEKPRPWDFRPKLLTFEGEWLKDLSFEDIWDDLYSLKDTNIDMTYIATIFFRMAFMFDSKLTTRMLKYEDIDADGNIVGSGELEFTWYEYDLPQNILDRIQISPSILRGCSLLPYLAYNDYLAQNEDCKYYYRDTIEKGGEWDGKVGRQNTLLTHMSVIAFIEGHYKFTEIIGMFRRSFGVAPLAQKYWEVVTGGRVIK